MLETKKLSGAQKLVKWFSPASRFEKIMQESKQWKFTCSCSKTSSIWDIGGVRYGAKGNPVKRIRCPYCGELRMQRIFKDV